LEGGPREAALQSQKYGELRVLEVGKMRTAAVLVWGAGVVKAFERS